MAPRTKNDPKNQSFVPLLGAMLGTKIDKNRFQERSKRWSFFDWFWGRVLMAFGPNLAPTWRPKPSQNRPKLDQKSIKKNVKMLINFLLDSGSLWGRFLVNFASKLEGRGTKKQQKLLFLLYFCYFGQLVNKRLYDRFFGQLGPQLEAQNPPNFDPRCLQNR